MKETDPSVWPPSPVHWAQSDCVHMCSLFLWVVLLIPPVPAPPLSLILPLKQAPGHTIHQQFPLFIFQGHQRETEVSWAKFCLLWDCPAFLSPIRHHPPPPSLASCLSTVTTRYWVTAGLQLTRWVHPVKIPLVPFISLITPGSQQVGLPARRERAGWKSCSSAVCRPPQRRRRRWKSPICLLLQLCLQSLEFFRKVFCKFTFFFKFSTTSVNGGAPTALA